MTQNSLLKQRCDLKFWAMSDPVFWACIFEPDTGFPKYKYKGPYKKPISWTKILDPTDSKKNQLLKCHIQSILTPTVFLFVTPSDSESGFDNGPRWWQSPSLQYGSAYQAVTLTINLKQLYQVTFRSKGLSHAKETRKWWTIHLKVHKIENFFGFDFEICTFS